MSCADVASHHTRGFSCMIMVPVKLKAMWTHEHEVITSIATPPAWPLLVLLWIKHSFFTESYNTLSLKILQTCNIEFIKQVLPIFRRPGGRSDDKQSNSFTKFSCEFLILGCLTAQLLQSHCFCSEMHINIYYYVVTTCYIAINLWQLQVF